ncbi:MAG: Coenzyme F420 hydrogenase/dehydrogenase, beta subunit C-terminal domain [Roseobacter sp.]
MIVPALRAPEPRGLCTDCGVSRMKNHKACGRACQFIAPDYPNLEQTVHGHRRGAGDETFFGPFEAMHRAALTPAAEGAQWTGITTALAADLLVRGKVDAVLTMIPDAEDVWRPVPALLTDPAELARARGMRMGYAPLLALLETAQERGFKRLAVIGIPCQVYALRSLEKELGLDLLYVIGTPCSDNTTTENFHQFLELLDEDPDSITYLEFRADYRVELRYTDGRMRTIPFLSLPISDLPQDFFPLTCRTCVDYTNVLADITVGYMGGTGEQWLLVRNARGAEMLAGLEGRITLAPPQTAGKRAGAVKGFIANTARAAGGLPLRRMPNWLRPLVSFLQPRIGPRGLEFARARVEMKAAETVLHLRRAMPPKMKNMIPEHVWKIAAPYGLTPQKGEAPTSFGQKYSGGEDAKGD